VTRSPALVRLQYERVATQERETYMKSAKQNQTKEQENMNQMTDTAMKNYEHAMRAGLKLQEEAGRCWSNMLNQTTLAQDWQKRWSGAAWMANDMMPMAQKRMEEVMDLMEKNSRTGAELMKKAVDAAQTPAMADSQAKWMDFWTSSMGAVRSNTEALTQIGTKAIDSWIDFVRKSAEGAEARVARAA
jgi:hypothetical protein